MVHSGSVPVGGSRTCQWHTVRAPACNKLSVGTGRSIIAAMVGLMAEQSEQQPVA